MSARSTSMNVLTVMVKKYRRKVRPGSWKFRAAWYLVLGVLSLRSFSAFDAGWGRKLNDLPSRLPRKFVRWNMQLQDPSATCLRPEVLLLKTYVVHSYNCSKGLFKTACSSHNVWPPLSKPSCLIIHWHHPQRSTMAYTSTHPWYLPIPRVNSPYPLLNTRHTTWSPCPPAYFVMEEMSPNPRVTVTMSRGSRMTALLGSNVNSHPGWYWSRSTATFHLTLLLFLSLFTFSSPCLPIYHPQSHLQRRRANHQQFRLNYSPN